MTKLYKHKTKNHIVRLIDIPLEHTDNTPDEQTDGLLKYAYCHRQIVYDVPKMGYHPAIKNCMRDDEKRKPFLMEWDRFCKLYEDIK